MWKIYVYIHCRDCTWSTIATKRFLHKSVAVRNVDWVLIIGLKIWRWLGEYVTYDKTFSNFSLTGSSSRPRTMLPLVLYSIAICGLSCCTIFVHIISQTERFSREGDNEHEMCVLIVSTNLSETFLILRRSRRHVIITVHRSSCRVPVIFVRF